MDSKKIVLIIIGILIVIALAIGFYYWFQEKTGEEEKEIGLCADYPMVEGEITCQEAKRALLEKYPGQVLAVEKGEVILYESKEPTNSNKGEEIEIKEQAWIFTVNVDTPFVAEEEGQIINAKKAKIFAGLYDSNKIGVYLIQWTK